MVGKGRFVVMYISLLSGVVLHVANCFVVHVV